MDRSFHPLRFIGQILCGSLRDRHFQLCIRAVSCPAGKGFALLHSLRKQEVRRFNVECPRGCAILIVDVPAVLCQTTGQTAAMQTEHNRVIYRRPAGVQSCVRASHGCFSINRGFTVQRGIPAVKRIARPRGSGESAIRLSGTESPGGRNSTAAVAVKAERKQSPAHCQRNRNGIGQIVAAGNRHKNASGFALARTEGNRTAVYSGSVMDNTAEIGNRANRLFFQIADQVNGHFFRVWQDGKGFCLNLCGVMRRLNNGEIRFRAGRMVVRAFRHIDFQGVVSNGQGLHFLHRIGQIRRSALFFVTVDGKAVIRYLVVSDAKEGGDPGQQRRGLPLYGNPGEKGDSSIRPCVPRLAGVGTVCKRQRRENIRLVNLHDCGACDTLPIRPLHQIEHLVSSGVFVGGFLRAESAVLAVAVKDSRVT